MLELSLTPVPQLSTARLLLRPIATDDLDALFALRSDPRVMQHIGRPLAKSIDDAVKLMADMRAALESKAGITWAIARRGAAEMIGTIGFYRIEALHHRGELGYLLRPDCWGQSLTSEAARAVVAYGFDVLRFHRIEACVAPANAASFGLLESLGFKREAHMIQNHHFEGAFLDTLVYGRLCTQGPLPPRRSG